MTQLEFSELKLQRLFRNIAVGLPLTLATSALRSILTRGWGLMEQEVYMGFVATISWIALFLIITMVALKMKQN